MSQSPPASVSSPIHSRAVVAPASPARLLGNWQLHRLVGQGTITSVYDARPLGCPPSWPADYVVKLLRPEYRQDKAAVAAMRREAEVGRRCSHPNLVPILESHVDSDPPHIVMPKLDGANLSEVIRGVGRLIVPQALWLTRQIAQALRHLHSQAWLHGDVKPANIMVSRQGHATLIDLAFAMKPVESFYSPDRPMLGSLAYVAPELLTSANTTQPASDIYSLGVTLFEMLSGRLPFQHTEASRLVEAHLQDSPPDLQRLSLNIPQPVCELITRMLAKSSLRRPSNCDALIDELTELEIETLESRIART
jgi:eukaryotic-like serine/threonine-protein kinase